MTPRPHRAVVRHLRLEECEARVTPAGPGSFLFAPGFIAVPPHAVPVPAIHRPGDGFPAAAARGWKEAGDTSPWLSKVLTEGAAPSETAGESAVIHFTHTPSAASRRDVHASAVGLDTPSADDAGRDGLTPSASAATQPATTPQAPAAFDAPAAVSTADVAGLDAAASADLHGVEVGAGVSPRGSSAAVGGGGHLGSPGLPSVGWLTASSSSGWLPAPDSALPAPARGPVTGQGAESNRLRAEAPSAGVIGSTSVVGLDGSEASPAPAPNGMAEDPQEGAAPAGATDATALAPSGEVRAEGGELQLVAAPAQAAADVTGLEGAVGQLFGWVTDLSSLSAGNKLGLYLALLALGSAAAGAEVRRRKRRAGSEKYTAATRQPRLAVLEVRT
jgi:hypothetical protein